jgi:hypothetical protein
MIATSRRAIATHEAGHATAMWLSGRGDSIAHVQMTVSDDCLAAVRLRGGSRENWVQPYDENFLTMTQAAPLVFVDLSGPCAEGLASREPFPRWFEAMADEGLEGDATNAESYGRRLAVAPDVRLAFFRRAARWTEDVLTIPRIWKTVKTLAAVLEDVKALDGTEAVAIMTTAFGPGDPGRLFETCLKRW